jgi:hypothetical protein
MIARSSGITGTAEALSAELYRADAEYSLIADRGSAEQFHARRWPNNATPLSGIDWLWSAKRA